MVVSSIGSGIGRGGPSQHRLGAGCTAGRRRLGFDLEPLQACRRSRGRREPSDDLGGPLVVGSVAGELGPQEQRRGPARARRRPVRNRATDASTWRRAASASPSTSSQRARARSTSPKAEPVPVVATRPAWDGGARGRRSSVVPVSDGRPAVGGRGEHARAYSQQSMPAAAVRRPTSVVGLVQPSSLGERPDDRLAEPEAVRRLEQRAGSASTSSSRSCSARMHAQVAGTERLARPSAGSAGTARGPLEQPPRPRPGGPATSGWTPGRTAAG